MDENVERINYRFLKDFDIIGLTGMIPQKDRMKSILLQLREMKMFTVVGGAYATVK